MPGVVVRYAKGKGFLMDEYLAKVWVCSQLTNIIRNLSEEQAGISLHSQWICAECRNRVATVTPTTQTPAPPATQYDSDNA